MVRPAALILLLLLSACASPQAVPPAPVPAAAPAAGDEGAEPPDPRIKPLTVEQEEQTP